MKTAFLVDTNILIYAYDRSEPAKMAKAQRILRWLGANHAGFLSTQVLAEFFWTVTRRIPAPLTPADGLRCLEDLSMAWEILSVTAEIVRAAGRGAVTHQLQFWDAQLWATAKLNQISLVLSEDFSHGSRIEGVQFLNPSMAALPSEE